MTGLSKSWTIINILAPLSTTNWNCFTLILFNRFLFFPLFAGLGHSSLKIGNNSRELWKRSNIAGILWSFPPLRGGYPKESPASPGCSPLYTVCLHRVIDVQSQNAGPTDWKNHFSFLLHRRYGVLICLLCTSAFCKHGANPLWGK